ncbi:class I SAM-dependent methyltransferase [Microbacterium sp. CPCC 204701]|uniref:class I SAM-dependent methyltransferase n=1 Tax=Microbacterium sp. CPCC 204701 TaxID=2493084 RepID=UPI000FDA691C|nr:class I SAM-dependent methyltransferase [Microbacterium sp. CPCC 204701]
MDLSLDERRAGPGSDGRPFWLSPASYWLPAHLPVSAWLTHGPFASWLMDVLRPRRIVELGTHYGYSCFVFAEAIKRLGLDASVDAVDSWEGDDHAGHYGPEVFDYVRSVVESDYPAIVRLVRGWFSQARPVFEDASVNLLHIDGRHGYDDASADYTDWNSTVRAGGVILFHDIAERDSGFGVWRLWEELAEPGRSFAFHHGHGLGVLAVGEIACEPLRELFSADEDTAARIRADYERLGGTVLRQAWLESLPEDAERAWAEVRRRAVHEDELEAAIAALRTSTSWRVTAPLRRVGKLRPPRP